MRSRRGKTERDKTSSKAKQMGKFGYIHIGNRQDRTGQDRTVARAAATVSTGGCGAEGEAEGKGEGDGEGKYENTSGRTNNNTATQQHNNTRRAVDVENKQQHNK